jgi:hypothetical protein
MNENRTRPVSLAASFGYQLLREPLQAKLTSHIVGKRSCITITAKVAQDFPAI